MTNPSACLLSVSQCVRPAVGPANVCPVAIVTHISHWWCKEGHTAKFVVILLKRSIIIYWYRTIRLMLKVCFYKLCIQLSVKIFWDADMLTYQVLVCLLNLMSKVLCAAFALMFLSSYCTLRQLITNMRLTWTISVCPSVHPSVWNKSMSSVSGLPEPMRLIKRHRSGGPKILEELGPCSLWWLIH